MFKNFDFFKLDLQRKGKDFTSSIDGQCVKLLWASQPLPPRQKFLDPLQAASFLGPSSFLGPQVAPRLLPCCKEQSIFPKTGYLPHCFIGRFMIEFQFLSKCLPNVFL